MINYSVSKRLLSLNFFIDKTVGIINPRFVIRAKSNTTISLDQLYLLMCVLKIHFPLLLSILCMRQT